MSAYDKPFLTLDGQIDLLKSRGMVITDRDRARRYLSKINYYRLSAYWYPFRKRSVSGATTILEEDFNEGVHFSDALDLYIFDKKLRLICLDALERIEIALRTDITIELAQLNPWAHREPEKLHGNFTRRGANSTDQSKHEKWLERVDSKAEKSKEAFAEHFRSKYPGAQMPLWVASELWDFGALSHLYSGLKVVNRTSVASIYGSVSWKEMETWLRSLNDVRNICAHHSRLWNRPLVNQPRWPAQGIIPDLDHLGQDSRAQTRIYAALLVMRHMLRTISPNSTWCLWLIDHLDTFPANDFVSLKNAGFPDDWRTQAIWDG